MSETNDSCPEESQIFPPLFVICQKCKGTGYVDSPPSRFSRCWECEDGEIVTEFGEHVLKFLRGRLKASIE